MIPFFLGLLTGLTAFFRSRCSLSLEIIALRQQLGMLKRNNPHPRLQIHDRIFWILLRRFWSAWSNVLVIVKPETVVAWHRAGLRCQVVMSGKLFAFVEENRTAVSWWLCSRIFGNITWKQLQSLSIGFWQRTDCSRQPGKAGEHGSREFDAAWIPSHGNVQGTGIGVSIFTVNFHI